MADRETVIGPETRISGEVRGEEDLLVRGRIDGRVQLTQTLTVAEGGVVQADVDVRVLVVSGVVVGNIAASETVRLTETARVIGDITAPRIAIEAGAAYRGRVEMGDDATATKAARAAASTSERSRSAPRMAPPPRAVATAAAPRLVAPAQAAAPRVASLPAPRAMTPPSGAVSSGAAPAWAKKKLRRR